MANSNMSISEVKSVCGELEKSPSCHQGSSPIYSGGGKASSKHSTPGKFGHTGGTTGGKSRKIKKSSKSPYTE